MLKALQLANKTNKQNKTNLKVPRGEFEARKKSQNIMSIIVAWYQKICNKCVPTQLTAQTQLT